MTDNSFQSYPPSLSPEGLSHLVTSLTDYCLAHGIIVRPPTSSETNHLGTPPSVTCFPSLFPRKEWEEALKLQTTYNLLYTRVANDVEWLANIMEEYSSDLVRV